MGKPIITTNEVGCREAVDEARTGFLCRARSVDSLVEAMERMLDLDDAALAAMGAEARRKAERQFDEKQIFQAYLDALRR
jgi:glycosyltransferase involved in cell wall biosynthesis